MSDEAPVVEGSAGWVHERRVQCLLLLDVSSSISGEKIQDLNAALEMLRTELLKDEVAARRVEVAIVTCGGSMGDVRDFVSPSELRPPFLSAEDANSIGKALFQALALIDQRRARYEVSDLDNLEPWIFILTEGETRDPSEVLESAAKVIREAEGQASGMRILVFAIGVEGANIQELARRCKRPPIKLQGVNFGQLFRWIGQSLTTLSRSLD